MRGCMSLESGIFVADNGQRTGTRGVLRGPRGPKKQGCFIYLGPMQCMWRNIALLGNLTSRRSITSTGMQVV